MVVLAVAGLVTVGAYLTDPFSRFSIVRRPFRVTFGQAVQEKLASGVPVVAVAASGMLDLVRDGVNGRLSSSEPWPR